MRVWEQLLLPLPHCPPLPAVCVRHWMPLWLLASCVKAHWQVACHVVPWRRTAPLRTGCPCKDNLLHWRAFQGVVEETAPRSVVLVSALVGFGHETSSEKMGSCSVEVVCPDRCLGFSMGCERLLVIEELLLKEMEESCEVDGLELPQDSFNCVLWVSGMSAYLVLPCLEAWRTPHKAGWHPQVLWLVCPRKVRVRKQV